MTDIVVSGTDITFSLPWHCVYMLGLSARCDWSQSGSWCCRCPSCTSAARL